MGFGDWFSKLFQVSVRRRVRCALSDEDVRRLDDCRIAVEIYLGDGSDISVVRLALRLYSRLVKNGLPTLYVKEPDGKYRKVSRQPELAVVPAANQVVRELQLQIGRKSLNTIRQLACTTNQDEAGVLRSAVATLHRATVGEGKSFFARANDGKYTELELIDLALRSE